MLGFARLRTVASDRPGKAAVAKSVLIQPTLQCCGKELTDERSLNPAVGPTDLPDGGDQRDAR